MTSTRDERVRCEVRAAVSVEPNPEKPTTGRPRPKLYEYVGPFGSLELWLDENNDFADVNLSNASREIAARIISDLSAR